MAPLNLLVKINFKLLDYYSNQVKDFGFDFDLVLDFAGGLSSVNCSCCSCYYSEGQDMSPLDHGDSIRLGAEITTIEGISDGDKLHPMQAAFKENHGLQCGFCTPGMVMSGIDIVRRYRAEDKELTAEDIRHELEGNICRCTGYHNIVKSIHVASKEM